MNDSREIMRSFHACTLPSQVRESYVSLGHKPERRLYERIEAARARVRRLQAAQKQRQIDAMVALSVAEKEIRRKEV